MIAFEPIIVAWGFQRTRPGSLASILKTAALAQYSNQISPWGWGVGREDEEIDVGVAREVHFNQGLAKDQKGSLLGSQ